MPAAAPRRTSCRFTPRCSSPTSHQTSTATPITTSTPFKLHCRPTSQLRARVGKPPPWSSASSCLRFPVTRATAFPDLAEEGWRTGALSPKNSNPTSDQGGQGSRRTVHVRRAEQVPQVPLPLARPETIQRCVWWISQFKDKTTKKLKRLQKLCKNTRQPAGLNVHGFDV